MHVNPPNTVNWKKRIIYSMYRLQQKIAMTRQESYALATLLSLLLLGTVIQFIQKRTFLFDSNMYAETDSLFVAATLEMHKQQALKDSILQQVNRNAIDRIENLKQILVANGKININTASQEELEQLPRIGPAIAQRIIKHRQTVGPFKKPEDLTQVKGIGPKTLTHLKPHITTTP